MPDLYNMYPTVTWETVKTLEVRSLVYSNLKSWAERWQGGKAERKAFLGIFKAKQDHYEVPFRAEEAEKAERRAPFWVFGTKRISVVAGANSSHSNLTVYYMKSPRLVSAVEPLGDLGAKAYFFFLKSPLFQASMNSFQAKALNIC